MIPIIRHALFPFLHVLLLLVTGCGYSSDVPHSGRDQEMRDYRKMCILRLATTPPADQGAILQNCLYYITYYDWKQKQQNGD